MAEAAISVATPVRHCSKLLLERRGREASQSGSAQLKVGLVIGCGDGAEVVYLGEVFAGAQIVGCDIDANFSPRARSQAKLLLADVKRLPFGAETFDFAVAIHSLEHVGDPEEALAEVVRVLRPGAWFYVGVPNRTRIFGYLGSPNATLWQKFAWNAIDYTNRIRGRFRNELGAHAGFERKELEQLLENYFTGVEVLTEEYLHFKYDKRLPLWMLNFVLAPRRVDYSAPSHYALCRKTGGK